MPTPSPQALAHHDEDASFLDMAPLGEGRWRVQVGSRLLTPLGTLYGGAGVAVAAAALEGAAGRPLRWCTAQFVASVTEGDVLDVSADIGMRGGRVTQASVEISCEGRLVVSALGALGETRPERPSATWIAMPEVAPPEDCPPFVPPAELAPSHFEITERRVAAGPVPLELADGGSGPHDRVALWSRVEGHSQTTPAVAAWLADMVPMAIGARLGEPAGAASLDNTVRITGPMPVAEGWVLVELVALAAGQGYGHGAAHVWSPDGELLATGDQTAVMRPASIWQPRQP